MLIKQENGLYEVYDRFEKDPKELVDGELLEKYSFYAKKKFRLDDEQKYIAWLRQEILLRMQKKG